MFRGVIPLYTIILIKKLQVVFDPIVIFRLIFTAVLVGELSRLFLACLA